MSVAQVPAYEQKVRSQRKEPVLGFLLCLLMILSCAELPFWGGMFSVSLQARMDFRAFYTAGLMLRTGHRRDMYDYPTEYKLQNAEVSRDATLPFEHLACEAILFMPLSLVPYKAAYFAYLLFNLSLLWISALVLRKSTSGSERLPVWLLASMCLLFVPTQVALMQGQDSVFILLLLSSAIALAAKDDAFVSGAMVGLALFKFQIALPVFVTLLLCGRLVFCAGFLGSAVAELIVSVALIGVHEFRVYLQMLRSMSIGLVSGADQARLAVRPADMPNLRGLIFVATQRMLSHSSAELLTIFFSLGLLVLTAVFARKIESLQHLLAVSVCVSLLIGYHTLAHDWVILMIPIIVFLSQSLFSRPRAAWGVALFFSSPVWLLLQPRSFFLLSFLLIGFLAFLLWLSHPTYAQREMLACK